MLNYELYRGFFKTRRVPLARSILYIEASNIQLEK